MHALPGREIHCDLRLYSPFLFYSISSNSRFQITYFCVKQIMSAVAIAQKKLKIAQALERQAATELISAAKLDAYRKVRAQADTLEGGKKRKGGKRKGGKSKAAGAGKKRKSSKRKGGKK